MYVPVTKCTTLPYNPYHTRLHDLHFFFFHFIAFFVTTLHTTFNVLLLTFITICGHHFHFSGEAVMPMIPLGLKETKEVNFLEPFSDFILEHYSEESDMYQDAIADITDTRQVRNKINFTFDLWISFMENNFCSRTIRWCKKERQ